MVTDARGGTFRGIFRPSSKSATAWLQERTDCPHRASPAKMRASAKWLTGGVTRSALSWIDLPIVPPAVKSRRSKAWSARLLQKARRLRIKLRPTQPSFEYEEKTRPAIDTAYSPSLRASSNARIMVNRIMVNRVMVNRVDGQPRFGVGEIRFVNALDPQDAYVFL